MTCHAAINGCADWNRVYRDQGVSLRAGEVRVTRQHLDRELHLVDHALSGAMAIVEQFKVAYQIVASVAVLVVDRLGGAKKAADVLRHNPPVFQHLHLFASRARKGRNADPNVAVALDVAPYLFCVEFVKRALLLMLNLAGLAAQFLLLVYAATGLSAVAGFLAALDADEFGSRVRILFASGVGAVVRAIHRLAVEFLPVRRQVPLHHRERLAAFLAGEADWNATGRRKGFTEAMGTPALKAAILAACLFVAGVAVKFLAAVFAGHLDGHIGSPLFDDSEYAVSLSGRQVQSNHGVM